MSVGQDGGFELSDHFSEEWKQQLKAQTGLRKAVNKVTETIFTDFRWDWGIVAHVVYDNSL